MTAIEDMCLLAGARKPGFVVNLLHSSWPPWPLPAACCLGLCWGLTSTDSCRGLPPVGTCPAELLSSLLSNKDRAWWALVWAATRAHVCAPTNLLCRYCCCAVLPAGEADLYLHLRFKDEATAGSLYRKHGFTSAKKDCLLVLLLGQEPRFLMLKHLAADRMLAGQVALPGFKQGVTAAELQQEEQDQQQQEEAAAGAGEEGVDEGQAAAVPAASPTA